MIPIIEMVTYANFALSPVSTRAASETARYIAEQSIEERRRLQAAYSLGLGVMANFDELYKMVKQCSVANWDGYGAAPVPDRTGLHTKEFLEALPLGTIAPTVGAEPDGHITLEWYKSPRRTLSISISPEGELHYAALLGPEKKYGTKPFWGEVPEDIMRIIRQVESR
ncbi:MAG: hypothetical protein HY786_01685 [Deltaproteobacteria bacterium]|nr:hypothetical protein [Deltaproteobacteria bacterium]